MQKRKVIGIDIDNTLADTDQVVRDLIKSRLNISSSRSDITSWSYGMSLGFSKEIEKEIFDYIHNYSIQRIKIKDNAKKGIDFLRQYFEIWLITQRPRSTKNQTENWLAINEISYSKLIFIYNKIHYWKRLDFIIDDNGRTAEKFASKGVTTLLFDSPWNNYLTSNNVIRVNNWLNIISYFQQRNCYLSVKNNNHLC